MRSEAKAHNKFVEQEADELSKKRLKSASIAESLKKIK